MGLLGSSWISCRVADRRNDNPGVAGYNVGFRLARSSVP